MEGSQPQLRYVVIGVGAGVFTMHRPALQQPGIQVIAVSDINAETGQQRAAEFHCAFYSDYRQMLSEVQPDIALILTPHPLHASIAIDCLQAGCHVLVEKPMAVQVAEADAMIAAARQQQRLLGVVFQHRFRPEMLAAHELIHSGKLGKIQHVDMSVIWTRPASYYQVAPWRGTWKGEGGGVSMNQGAHNLDLLCYLLGLPTRVYAWTRRLQHTIETEDTVQAMLEWSNGALGSLHLSTAEAKQPESLKIAGTRGYLEIIDGRPALHILDTDLETFIATSQEPFSAPSAHSEQVISGDSKGNHSAVHRQFYEAVAQGHPFTSEGEQGRMELELTNAIIYSGLTHQEVELPLNRQRYADLLAHKQEGA